MPSGDAGFFKLVLAACRSKTEFTLTSEDIPVGTATEKQMSSGGDMIASTLKKVIETGQPSFGIRLLHIIFKLTEPFSPAKTKVEHWPLEP